MGDLSPWHLAILAIVVVVLFGSKKLPDAARALGRSMRIFKSETRGLREDNAIAEAHSAPPPVFVAPTEPPVPTHTPTTQTLVSENALSVPHADRS